MAYFLNAKCSNCNYHKEGLTFGATMIRHTPMIPAIDPETNELCSAESGYEDLVRYYHQREMFAIDIEGDGIESDGFKLNPEGNLCPHCQAFKLSFTVGGNID